VSSQKKGVHPNVTGDLAQFKKGRDLTVGIGRKRRPTRVVRSGEKKKKKKGVPRKGGELGFRGKENLHPSKGKRRGGKGDIVDGNEKGGTDGHLLEAFQKKRGGGKEKKKKKKKKSEKAFAEGRVMKSKIWLVRRKRCPGEGKRELGV